MRVNSPPVLLGYQSSHSSAMSGYSASAHNMSTIKGQTYLQLFITIEPQLQPAQPMAEKVRTELVFGLM